jgi:beta-lactamase regulating signal transducer with metallopeptidase domain
MSEIFLGFVNRAVVAGWLVLAVIVLRLLLRRAPRSVVCLLWGVAALRLLLPFSIPSAASLVPSAETVVPASIYSARPVIETGIPVVNSQVSDYLQDHYFEGVTVPAGAAARLTDTLSVLWLAGMALLLLYCLGTYLHLRSRLRTAVRLRDNLWQSEWVDSPFVLGLFRPRIYLPFSLDGDTLAHVEAHERAHIARGDHVWKLLAFLLLAAYWFHPLLWAAYFLFCRDLESACDERVVRDLDGEGRRQYSRALLRCAAPRRRVAPCPVAFGELGVGARIKGVLHYRKPAFWVVLIAVIALIVTAVCFLTDPPVKDGLQWLRTRRSYNLGETSLLISYGPGSQPFYNHALTGEQRRELSRLLRSVTDDQLTDAGFDMEYPPGASLVFGGSVALSRPMAISRPGVVLLYYKGARTYVNSPDLANWLEGVLPGAPLTWRCTYSHGKPDSGLTLYMDFSFISLEIHHATGSFAGGTPPVCVKEADGSIAVTSGCVSVLWDGDHCATWTPPQWDGTAENAPGADTFGLLWADRSNPSVYRRAELHVFPMVVSADGQEAVIDWYITPVFSTVPLRYSLEGGDLFLSTPYPVIDRVTFNDFYGAEDFDVDGDGVKERCTMGMGPTSGLFTFTFAAQAGDEVKYASIFNTGWCTPSFVWENGVLKVRGVDGANLYDISVRDRAVILSADGKELPAWGGFPPES